MNNLSLINNKTHLNNAKDDPKKSGTIKDRNVDKEGKNGNKQQCKGIKNALS
jgi:hypothetical protein